MIGDSEEEENNNNKKRKKSSTNKGLLITIDLFHANYEILLITYQEFTIRNAKNAQKKLKSNVNLLDLKIIDYITNVENAINHTLSYKMKQLKIS